MSMVNHHRPVRHDCRYPRRLPMVVRVIDVKVDPRSSRARLQRNIRRCTPNLSDMVSVVLTVLIAVDG